MPRRLADTPAEVQLIREVADRTWTMLERARARGVTAVLGPTNTGKTHLAIERMLAHPNIKLMLNTDYRDIVDVLPWTQMVYTGPIDAFFDCRHGRLPYRSLDFEHATLAQAQFQAVGTVNHPNDYAYTRVTEFKHLTGQQHPGTSVVREYPSAEGDPYYPIPRPENEALYKRYEAMAEAEVGVHFIGRLAQYRYYNMDQVVASALALCERLLAARSAPAPLAA